MGESDFAPLAQKVRVFLKDSKGIDSAIQTARTQTSFLDVPCLKDNLSSSDFCFLDLKREKMTVYIMLPPKMIYTYSRWFRLLVTAALDEMMTHEKKGEKPVLFMLDEFAILGHLSCIETAIGYARGCGIQLFPFLQDINQLKDIYGERSDSFFANAGIQQFFTPNDSKTADVIQKRCGEKTSFATSISYGENVSSTEAERKIPLYSAYDLLGMPMDEQLLFLAGSSSALKAGRLPYFKNPKYIGMYEKNPYI